VTRFVRLSTEERSPLAKAAAGSPAAVGKTARGFESLPSPPLSISPAVARSQSLTLA